MDRTQIYEVIIIGAGPAGLSAALILGRCRRRVLVFDSGEYRNAASRSMHGFLTRDGIDPAELRRLGREQLTGYGVNFCEAKVAGACSVDGAFRVTLADGTAYQARKMLIATGVVDHLPEIQGAGEYFGRGIFHCPYCDGWEMRDQRLAVYGKARSGAGLALSLKRWSADVVLCTDGAPGLPRRRKRPPEAPWNSRTGGRKSCVLMGMGGWSGLCSAAVKRCPAGPFS